jgi:hypothetical protein
MADLHESMIMEKFEITNMDTTRAGLSIGQMGHVPRASHLAFVLGAT